MNHFEIWPQSKLVIDLDPLGFFDFVKLERNARCVLSDSGTVQEECCIYNVPNVTLRSVTERAETIECGSAILADDIMKAVEIALGSTTAWMPPTEYLNRQVSATVTKIILGV
jgi:UDP-N-acetylglucosamine 2-epimerase (non-hydrolysing)